MTSYKDILMKTPETPDMNTPPENCYMIGPLTMPIKCFTCKQLFHTLYQFTYSMKPCTYSYGGVKNEWSMFCLDCMNARMAEEDYKKEQKDIKAHKLARMVTCIECNDKVEPEDILRNGDDEDLLYVCRAKCYKKVYPRGLDRTDYDEMIKEIDGNNGNCTETAHKTEDEIYRRFVCDVATGHFSSPEKMIEMAKKIKDIIDDRIDCCRWYA
jgi:hypothetical protein